MAADESISTDAAEPTVHQVAGEHNARQAFGFDGYETSAILEVVHIGTPSTFGRKTTQASIYAAGLMSAHWLSC